jgi:enolase
MRTREGTGHGLSSNRQSRPSAVGGPLKNHCRGGAGRGQDTNGIGASASGPVLFQAHAGYALGKQIFFALDMASSEFYNGNGTYTVKKSTGKTASGEELVALYAKLCAKYPIVSIEDGCAGRDWKNWKKLTDKLGGKIQLVGDDIFVTNVKFLRKASDTGTANSILVKVNQIGSLTETLDCIELAKRNRYTSVISYRSGETEDATIADIAVATNRGQITTGSLSRTDRLAKYNQLLRIEQSLGRSAVYAGLSTLPKGQ